jgi:DNA-binding NtrC family response regulator
VSSEAPPPNQRLLVVEDDPDQRRLVAGILRGRAFAVGEAASFSEAEKALEGAPIDLVLSDWKLPDGDGMKLLELVRASHPATGFVMVTAYGTIAQAVEAVSRGADDYLAKPFERQSLLLAIDKVLVKRRLLDENSRLAEALADRDRLVDLLGKAPSMQKLFRRLEKIAGSEATVLISGESGTGKELAARAVHALSRRAQGPFVAVNCAAIPDGLVEAEFFGVEKGAFTGADRSRPGKLELAAGGTLFLDEVGELPLALQPKLLRVLQEGRFTAVGGRVEKSADLRLLAATNRDLAEEVREGRFREDLFYRLNVVPLHMPALRERREDLALLVDHFAARAARRHGVRLAAFPAAVMKRLLDHAWPGNVRELANVIERLVLLAEDGKVSAADLPEEVAHPEPGPPRFRLPPAGLDWEEHERDCLRQALELAGGNRSRAARLLAMTYKAFLYRLEKHGLE